MTGKGHGLGKGWINSSQGRSRGGLRVDLGAIREALRHLELLAKLLGMINHKGSHADDQTVQIASVT